MTGEAGGSLDRRQLFGAGIVAAAAVGTPLWFWSKVRAGETGEATDEDRRLLAALCDAVIPATETPGASQAGVPAFVVVALNHGLDGTRNPSSANAVQGLNALPPQRGGLYLLDDLAARLNVLAGGDFATAPVAARDNAVARLDAAAFAPGHDDDPWHKIKDLILTGYYTSEVGGSKELNYELVPGRWDADIALKPGDRAYSSDWTAVDFG